MSKINDGGPAFPTPWAAGTATEGGMTLRDWFAGQALAGICQSCGSQPWEMQADHAYKAADAMIKERKK